MISNRATFDLSAGDPIVVLAADENFAIPLAVTVCSALENLATHRRLKIFVLDGGIHAGTKERLMASWPRDRCQVEWLSVDAAALVGLPCSGHINLVSYYRILIPRVLPTAIERVIYLDSDLIVRQDLGRLWDAPLADNLCLAAPDVSAPYLDSATMLPNYERCRPYLSSTNPVPNFRELGLSARAPYFNAGVMSINLAAWRQEDISRQCLECLDTNRQHVLAWDQYALNVVLANRWEALDLRWNQGSHSLLYPTWEESPLDRQTFDTLRESPHVVHFTTRDKPWMPLCQHPFRREFFAYLDQTQWAGWRPSRVKLVLELVRLQERRLRRLRKSLVERTRGLLNRDSRPRKVA